MSPAISLKGIGKKYRTYSNKSLRLGEVPGFGRKEGGHDFQALSEIDLEVEPGATLGVVGRNDPYT